MSTVSRGLANKMIVPRSTSSKCSACKGTGTAIVQANVSGGSIKNLQVSGAITIEADCPYCDGKGKRVSVVRIARRKA